jgi:crotonobetainyl-CoA:carnitine CoA-transferase CaiB-like acyl-CoA transferase
MEDKFWLALTNRTQEKFPTLSNPDWQTRMARTRCKASVATALKDFFSSLALSELIDLLPQQEVPWMRVMRGKDMLSDAHLLARGLVNGEGTDQQVGYPVMVNGERPLAPTGDCVLGDHTQDLLQSIGFNQDRIAQLIRKGVISPSPKSAK